MTAGGVTIALAASRQPRAVCSHLYPSIIRSRALSDDSGRDGQDEPIVKSILFDPSEPWKKKKIQKAPAVRHEELSAWEKKVRTNVFGRRIWLHNC